MIYAYIIIYIYIYISSFTSIDHYSHVYIYTYYVYIISHRYIMCIFPKHCYFCKVLGSGASERGSFSCWCWSRIKLSMLTTSNESLRFATGLGRLGGLFITLLMDDGCCFFHPETKRWRSGVIKRNTEENWFWGWVWKNMLLKPLNSRNVWPFCVQDFRNKAPRGVLSWSMFRN